MLHVTSLCIAHEHKILAIYDAITVVLSTNNVRECRKVMDS